MKTYEIKVTLDEEDYSYLRFKGVKMNMSIPGVIKKMIKKDRAQKPINVDVFSRKNNV